MLPKYNNNNGTYHIETTACRLSILYVCTVRMLGEVEGIDIVDVYIEEAI